MSGIPRQQRRLMWAALHSFPGRCWSAQRLARVSGASERTARRLLTMLARAGLATRATTEGEAGQLRAANYVVGALPADPPTFRRRVGQHEPVAIAETEPVYMDAAECDRIVRALKERGIPIAETARRIGMRRDTLVDRMRGIGRLGPRMAGALRALWHADDGVYLPPDRK